MTVRNGFTLIAPLAVALTLATGPAGAEHGGGPCRQDVEKLCPGMPPGPGSFRACLKQHASELSPECQEHMSQMKAKRAEWRKACEADVKAHCSDVAPGHHAVIKCLHQHQSDLSQACRDQLAQHHGHHERHAPAATPGGDTTSG